MQTRWTIAATLVPRAPKQPEPYRPATAPPGLREGCPSDAPTQPEAQEGSVQWHPPHIQGYVRQQPPHDLLHRRMVGGQPEEVPIPRIILRPKDKEYSFDWYRRQFPVRVAFTCTVNKSQGQSMKHVGVWLPHSVFGHGQLYLAVSRSGNKKNITIAHKPEKKDPANCLLKIPHTGDKASLYRCG